METSCGVVLVNYGTVLLLQYPQGHWDFPKGHVEADDEDHHSTAQRELAEETGIDQSNLSTTLLSEVNTPIVIEESGK